MCAVSLLFLLVAALAATCAATMPEDYRPDWRSPGLIGNGGWPFSRAAIVPEEADGAAYLPGQLGARAAGREGAADPVRPHQPGHAPAFRPSRRRGRTGRPGVAGRRQRARHDAASARRRLTRPARPAHADAAERRLDRLLVRRVELHVAARRRLHRRGVRRHRARRGRPAGAVLPRPRAGPRRAVGGALPPGRYGRRRRAPGAARQPGLGAVGDVVPARDRSAGGEPVDAVADGAPRRRPRRRLAALRRAAAAVTGLLGAEHLTRAGAARADARRVRADAGRPARGGGAGRRPGENDEAQRGAGPPSASKQGSSGASPGTAIRAHRSPAACWTPR